MVGRLVVTALSTLLLVAPHMASADARKPPVKAPASTPSTTRPTPTPKPPPAPPPTMQGPTAPGSSTCAADPLTEVACLRRENEELRQKLQAMIAAEAARKQRMAKQLGGGQAIEALR